MADSSPLDEALISFSPVSTPEIVAPEPPQNDFLLDLMDMTGPVAASSASNESITDDDTSIATTTTTTPAAPIAVALETIDSSSVESKSMNGIAGDTLPSIEAVEDSVNDQPTSDLDENLEEKVDQGDCIANFSVESTFIQGDIKSLDPDSMPVDSNTVSELLTSSEPDVNSLEETYPAAEINDKSTSAGVALDSENSADFIDSMVGKDSTCEDFTMTSSPADDIMKETRDDDELEITDEFRELSMPSISTVEQVSISPGNESSVTDAPLEVQNVGPIDENSMECIADPVPAEKTVPTQDMCNSKDQGDDVVEGSDQDFSDFRDFDNVEITEKIGEAEGTQHTFNAADSVDQMADSIDNDDLIDEEVSSESGKQDLIDSTGQISDTVEKEDLNAENVDSMHNDDLIYEEVSSENGNQDFMDTTDQINDTMEKEDLNDGESLSENGKQDFIDTTDQINGTMEKEDMNDEESLSENGKQDFVDTTDQINGTLEKEDMNDEESLSEDGKQDFKGATDQMGDADDEDEFNDFKDFSKTEETAGNDEVLDDDDFGDFGDFGSSSAASSGVSSSMPAASDDEFGDFGDAGDFETCDNFGKFEDFSSEVQKVESLKDVAANVFANAFRSSIDKIDLCQEEEFCEVDTSEYHAYLIRDNAAESKAFSLSQESQDTIRSWLNANEFADGASGAESSTNDFEKFAEYSTRLLKKVIQAKLKESAATGILHDRSETYLTIDNALSSKDTTELIKALRQLQEITLSHATSTAILKLAQDAALSAEAALSSQAASNVHRGPTSIFNLTRSSNSSGIPSAIADKRDCDSSTMRILTPTGGATNRTGTSRAAPDFPSASAQNDNGVCSGGDSDGGLSDPGSSFSDSSAGIASLGDNIETIQSTRKGSGSGLMKRFKGLTASLTPMKAKQQHDISVRRNDTSSQVVSMHLDLEKVSGGIDEIKWAAASAVYDIERVSQVAPSQILIYSHPDGKLLQQKSEKTCLATFLKPHSVWSIELDGKPFAG